MYIFDTDTCIEVMREHADNVFERIKTLSIGEAYISVVTLAELEYGVQHSANPAENATILSNFLSMIGVLPFTADAAVVYGQVREELEKIGKKIGALDTLIAAHTIALNATLVSNNTREFEWIAALKLENWLR